MNVSLANRKNPNFPALKAVGCKSPMLKKKRGKMREIFSLNLKRSLLKNDRIFMNSDWTITVTANERGLLEAENILYKVDGLSLTIICLTISVYETTRLYTYYIFIHNYTKC